MASSEDSQLVLVTGASGFIATHIVQQLLEEGYRVRGTVRSLEDEVKVKPLKELCPDADHQVELVEADLLKPESWESAVKDCSYVVHVASPYPTQTPSKEDDITKMAVEGTTAVLKACQKEKIQRLVMTSSVAAVVGGITGEADKTYKEDDWGDPEKADQYVKSKILAEKTAWDFIKELPEEEKFELAVINPVFVMGPVLCGSPCTSMEVPKKLLEKSMPFVPKLFFCISDVRDVASAHIKAMTVPEAAGNRHIVTTSGMWMKEIAQIISKEFKPQGYSVPTMHCPYFAVWLKALFDKSLKMQLPNIGKSVKLDNTRMKEVLGIEPREVNQTIVDMCYSMIEREFVKKSKKYKGPKKEGEEEAAEGVTEEAADEGKEANGTVTTGEQGEGEKEEEKGGDEITEKAEIEKSETVESKKEGQEEETKESAETEAPPPAEAEAAPTEGEEKKEEGN